MKLGFSYSVCRVSHLSVFEVTDVFLDAVYVDCSAPCVCGFVPANPKKARLAVFIAAPVLQVFGVGRFTQIANSVVCAVPVDVVNAVFWPYAVDVKPCQPVSTVSAPINTDLDVTPVRANAASNTANGVTREPRQAGEFASGFVVLKHLTQAFCGNEGLHAGAFSADDALIWRLYLADNATSQAVESRFLTRHMPTTLGLTPRVFARLLTPPSC